MRSSGPAQRGAAPARHAIGARRARSPTRVPSDFFAPRSKASGGSTCKQRTQGKQLSWGWGCSPPDLWWPEGGCCSGSPRPAGARLGGQAGLHRLIAAHGWNFCLQIGIDENDQNAAKNEKGSVEAVFTPDRDEVSPTPLAPYSEVFGLQRFRESEIIHGRWAMLATLGAVVAEATTGVSW